MNSLKRKEEILKLLKKSDVPISGTDIAEKFGVSRQIIVQDIALIRAEGNQIIATSKGYMYPKFQKNAIHKTVAVKHGSGMMAEELYIMIDYGAKILDITVEHPVYGEIKANLMLSTKEDIDLFVEEFNKSKAEPLSVVTNGVHLHTIEVPSNKIYELIKTALKDKGFLLEY
ncbi:MAG TPA: transcription repressor NadR [Eubacteriaceae bacterium]|jgi:hypothetical protein|nr:transcription repressor NadR [Eubacteriaceae bacterium]